MLTHRSGRSTRFVTVIAAITVVGAVLGACGSEAEDVDTGHTGDRARAQGFPVTLTSKLGAVTVKAEPERVVTLGWGSNDAALALGVKPVGMSIQVSADKDGITPWARQKLGSSRPKTFSDAGDIPFEKIASLRPDLILAVQSGLTPAQYKTLSAIAPTVGYPGRAWSTPWQKQLEMVGQALGRSERAAKIERQVDNAVTRAARAHPEFRGKTITYGSGTVAGSYNIYLPDDPRMDLLGKFGFTVSRAAVDTFDHGAGSPAFATTFSLEQISKLQTDVLVAWYLTPTVRRGIENSPVFGRLPAVTRGAYLPIVDDDLVFATSSPGPLTIPWMLRTYIPKLAAATAKAR